MVSEDLRYTGSGKWLVLSSDEQTWYNVFLPNLDKGIKACNCPAIKLECKHVRKIVSFIANNNAKVLNTR